MANTPDTEGLLNGLEKLPTDPVEDSQNLFTDINIQKDAAGESEDSVDESDDFLTKTRDKFEDGIDTFGEGNATRFSLKCVHIRLDLLKFKLFYFSFGGAIGAFFPYWSVYLKQMGLSAKQIGFLAGVKPLIGFWTGPLWGSVADRFRIRKLILGISAIGWLVSISSIGLVPSAKYSDDQCDYVRHFLNYSRSSLNTSMKSNTSHNPLDITTHIYTPSPSKADFDELHREIPGVSAMENILESRAWMFEPGGLNRVYYIFLTLTLMGEVVMSPTGALGDSICLEYLGNNQDDYGTTRAFGSIGIGILSLFVGALISSSRHDVTRCDVTVTISNYSYVYYTYAACMIVCFVSTLFFQSSSTKSSKGKNKTNPFKVFRMFLTPHYASWLFCMLFTGVCNGVIWGFLFWHLENIGATQLLLGVANGVSLFFEMLMFFVVFKILNRVGSITFMCVGLVGYSVRFAVFATMENPWWVLPFETLQGATFAGVWSAFVKYMCSNVPPEYSGTLQGFLHSVYWGVGAGSGHLIGGALIERLGARVTFWIFSGLSFFNMLLFVIVQKCSIKPDVFTDYSKLNETDVIELECDLMGNSEDKQIDTNAPDSL